MPDPPDLPGFYWDPHRKKYFRTVNGAIQGSTQKYHNNTVQSQKRQQRERDTSVKKKSSIAPVAQSPWSTSICQLLLGRTQGFGAGGISLLQSTRLGTYTTDTKLCPQGHWLCYWSPNCKVICVDSSQVTVPGHLIINDQIIHNDKLAEYLSRKKAMDLLNHGFEMEILPLIPVTKDDWVWWSIPVSFHGDMSYFPMVFHRQLNHTESLLRAIATLVSKNPRQSKMLSRLFGLNRTVLSVTTNVQETVNRINHLLKVTQGKGNFEMKQLMRQLEPGEGYWYADPLASKGQRCNLGNINVHICHHHLIVSSALGGVNIPIRENEFDVDNAEIWPAKPQIVGVGCKQGIPLFVTKLGKFEPGPQLSTNVLRVWFFEKWSIIETKSHQLLRVNDDGSVIQLGSLSLDNNPHLQLAGVGKYFVMGGRKTFTIIDTSNGARTTGVLPNTIMPLKGLVPLADGSIAFSYSGSTTTLTV